MAEEFERKTLDEYEKRKRKQISSMRSLMDYGIGIIIGGAGAFFFLRGYFDIPFNETFPPNAMDKIFGVICFVYGCWRIYRGYKRNYFK
jgi:hypothetical protein